MSQKEANKEAMKKPKFVFLFYFITEFQNGIDTLKHFVTLTMSWGH